MGRELAVVDDDRLSDGKAMASLSAQQRQFVIEMAREPYGKGSCMSAAKKAGYPPKQGYALMRNKNVLAALREEAENMLLGSGVSSVHTMILISQEEGHKDQYKAAKDLAALNGFTAEQRIVVEHVGEGTKEIVLQIERMAGELKMDARQLIEAVGLNYEEIVEAEFTEAGDGGTEV
jgi:phage terminase small subunit